MVLLIAWLVIGLFFAAIGSGMARRRNRDAAVWGILCFLFGPIGIILLAIAGQAGGSPVQVAHQRETDLNRWKALTELDADIASAAAKARAAGPKYEKILADKYLTLNDKQYLASALAKVLELAEQDKRIPSTGKVGASMYMRQTDGTYVITQGRYVGRSFVTFDEMNASLN